MKSVADAMLLRIVGVNKRGCGKIGDNSNFATSNKDNFSWSYSFAPAGH